MTRPGDDSSYAPDAAPNAILLAAGRGTRINTRRPKVLIEVAGRPMLAWIVDACLEASVERCVIVVASEQREEVVAAIDPDLPCCFVVQHEQLGTAHAARMAEPVCRSHRGDVFVLAGDGPLIRASTLEQLHHVHREQGAAATLATAILANPDGYGRILRDAEGGFDRIVEQKDATPKQLEVREVNPSYYCFRSEQLFNTLAMIEPHNRQGEYYLTEVPAVLKAEGHPIGLVEAVHPEDALSINTPEQLEMVDSILCKRLATPPRTDASS